MRRLMAYRLAGQRPPARERDRARGRVQRGPRADRRRRSAAGNSAGARAAARRRPLTLPDDGLDLDAFVASIERELIQRSLERTGGNKGQAAQLLNLKRTTLVEKLKRLGSSRRANTRTMIACRRATPTGRS